MDEQQLRQRAEGGTNETPEIDESGGGGGSTAVSAGGLDLGVSNQTLLLIGLAVAGAVVVWYLSRDTNGGGSSSGDDLGDMADADMSSEVPVEGDDEDEAMIVPSNPDDPLDADEAVIEQLKQSGRIGGGD